MDGRFIDRVRQTRAEALLDQTLKALDESGYDRFRVEDVARRVGIAKGTVYLDFPGKEQLIDSAIAWAGEALVTNVADSVAAIEDPRMRLMEAVHHLAREVVARPEWGVVFEGRSIRGGPYDGPAPCDPIRRYLEILVQQAREASALHDAEHEPTAEALLGLLSRPVWRHLAAHEGTGRALRRSGLSEVLAGPV